MVLVRACPLQVNSFLYTIHPEQVMGTPHALFETQTLEQLTQIVKTDGRIGCAAEKARERFLSAHNRHSIRGRHPAAIF
jgi:hypothetical protein